MTPLPTKIVTRFDLGYTEDEFNNLMIDLFEMTKKSSEPIELYYKDKVSNGELQVLKLTKKDFYNNKK